LSLLNIAFTSCEAAAGVSLLDSDVSIRDQVAAGVPSMLHAAAGLSPVVFHLDLPVFGHEPAVVDLPPFHRATSMQLYAPNYRFTLPRAGDGFHELEILSLTGCYVDLGALVLRCPCLRVLRVTQACLDAGINVQSKSLQKLFVRTNTNFRWKYSIHTINIDASMLKQLTLSFITQDELSVSVVAPLLEKVSWECSCLMTWNTTGLGPWSLLEVSLRAAASLGQRVITNAIGEGTCLQLSNAHVLSLQMSASVCLLSSINFSNELNLCMTCYHFFFGRTRFMQSPTLCRSI
jgi:hypothetical protein